MNAVAPIPINAALEMKSIAVSLACGNETVEALCNFKSTLGQGVRDMDIAEVAGKSGVPASTLRFYEEKGLIASVGRRGLRRTYGPGILERLALISLGRTAGFTLDEIGQMFAPDGKPRIDRGRLADKATELDRTIRRLGAIRDGLRHAAACPAKNHLECLTFRRLLERASSGFAKARKTPARRP
jgi:DNA-binding transcriptional MerR regulator